MNIKTPSIPRTPPRGLIAAALVGACISSFGAACNAAEAADVPTAVVKYADLDVSSALGAATLYSRIRFAAEGMCAPLEHGDVANAFRRQNCVKQAIAGAVVKVNQSALSAAYAARYGALQPAKILTADRR